MLPKSVIEQLSVSLNDRFYQGCLKALGVVSRLLVQRNNGSNVITDNELDVLLNHRFEDMFQIPNFQMVVNQEEGYVTINGYKFDIAERDTLILTWQANPAWSVVALDENGEYQLIACADQYAIPRGQYSVSFDLEARKKSPGAIVQDNVVLYGGQAIWCIENWTAVGKVLRGSEWFGNPISRIERKGAVGPQIVCNDGQAETIVVDQSLLTQNGIKVEGDLTVNGIIERLSKVEAETVAVEVDEELMKIMARVHKELDIDALVAHLKTLPAKKRTRVEIRGVMAGFLTKE